MAERKTILINDMAAHRRRSGIGAYVAELLAHLPRATHDLRIVPLSRTLLGAPLLGASKLLEWTRERIKRGSTSDNSQDLGSASFSRLKAVGVRAADEYLRAMSRLARWSLYHEPDALPLSISAKTVTTFHDLSVLLFPQWHPRDRVQKYERRLKEGLRQTSVFIADSEATKRDMAAMLGIAGDRVTVVPLAPRPVFRVLPPAKVAEERKRLNLPERYLLFVGTIEPRKNLGRLLRAYADLPPALLRRHPLLLAGGWGWRSDDVRELLSRSPWSESVRWTGYLSDDDLVSVMNGATAVVYPSLYEGFGLPPLEAMACGKPVVASAPAGSLGEVVGEAALTVDPNDEKGLARAMTELLAHPELAQTYIERGQEHVARFSWEKTSAATAAVYRRAA